MKSKVRCAKDCVNFGSCRDFKAKKGRCPEWALKDVGRKWIETDEHGIETEVAGPEEEENSIQEESIITIYLEFPRLRCPYCGEGGARLLDAEVDRFDSGHILELYECDKCSKQFQVELDTTLKGTIVPE